MKKIFSLVLVCGVIIFGLGASIAHAADTWITVGSAGFCANENPSLAFDPSTSQPYIACADSLSPHKITVRKFDGSSWVNVGSQNFSAGGASYISLAFNPSTGQPYVAYEDSANGSRITVMKYNGTSWENVGSAGFSAGKADYPAFAFNPSTKEPYVSFIDWANGYKITVMKFNGSSWVLVGSAGFAIATTNSAPLAFDLLTGQPYIVFMDGSNGSGATVMKFDGSSWVPPVGSAGFSTGEAYNLSLAFNPSTNQPYVAYDDDVFDNLICHNKAPKATVKKFNGSAWENVGSAGFSAGFESFIKLAFNPQTNQPYVTYEDDANGKKVTVMKYNGTSWENVGSAGFSTGEANSSISLAFNPSNYQPYVAYGDNSNGGRVTVMTFGSSSSPVITGGPSTITSNSISNQTINSATANWTTDSVSTGSILFGTKVKTKTIKHTVLVNGKKKTTTTKTTTISGGGTISDSTSNTSHSLNLTGLKKNKVYYYQITAQSGILTSQTGILKFKTLKK